MVRVSEEITKCLCGLVLVTTPPMATSVEGAPLVSMGMCSGEWRCGKFEGDRGARVGCCGVSQFEIDIGDGTTSGNHE